MNSIEEKRAGGQRGFSLVEFFVSILLTSIMLSAIYSVYRVQTHSVKLQENRLEAQEYARSTLDLMVREIRNAGYAPTGATCAGILIATTQTLQFFLDANGDGDCSDADENITYAYVALTKDISRTSITGGSAQILTDGNATKLQLIYYPQQTGATPPPPYCYVTAGDLVVNGVTCSGIVTANLGNIQRITVSLTVQSKNPDAEFGGQLNATMTSNADLRNRGLP